MNGCDGKMKKAGEVTEEDGMEADVWLWRAPEGDSGTEGGCKISEVNLNATEALFYTRESKDAARQK